jgi:hypothetical protein
MGTSSSSSQRSHQQQQQRPYNHEYKPTHTALNSMHNDDVRQLLISMFSSSSSSSSTTSTAVTHIPLPLINILMDYYRISSGNRLLIIGIEKHSQSGLRYEKILSLDCDNLATHFINKQNRTTAKSGTVAVITATTEGVSSQSRLRLQSQQQPLEWITHCGWHTSSGWRDWHSSYLIIDSDTESTTTAAHMHTRAAGASARLVCFSDNKTADYWNLHTTGILLQRMMPSSPSVASLSSIHQLSPPHSNAWTADMIMRRAAQFIHLTSPERSHEILMVGGTWYDSDRKARSKAAAYNTITNEWSTDEPIMPIMCEGSSLAIDPTTSVICIWWSNR